jgi:transcription elongation factor
LYETIVSRVVVVPVRLTQADTVVVPNVPKSPILSVSSTPSNSAALPEGPGWPEMGQAPAVQ